MINPDFGRHSAVEFVVRKSKWRFLEQHSYTPWIRLAMNSYGFDLKSIFHTRLNTGSDELRALTDRARSRMHRRLSRISRPPTFRGIVLRAGGWPDAGLHSCC